MNKPTKEMISKVMAELGRSKSAAKLKAARKNAMAPCRKGKQRGWPKGRPRKSVIAA